MNTLPKKLALMVLGSLVLMVLIFLASPVKANDKQAKRILYAQDSCPRVLIDIGKKQGYDFSGVTAGVIGEVRPYMFVVDYTFEDGKYQQAYCVFTESGIIYPFILDFDEAANIAK